MANDEISSAQTAAPKERAPFNYFAWIGPVVTVVGAISYFAYFAQFADLRDFPWVNLPLVGLGAVLSIAGLYRAIRTPGYGLLSKLFAGVAGLFSVALAGLFCFYIFDISYRMPDTDGVVEVAKTAPVFSLKDQNNQAVSLSDYRGKPLVITFYRGHW